MSKNSPVTSPIPTNFDITPFILNERNVAISKKFIQDKLKEYGIKHRVSNLEHFQMAVTHRSYMIRDPNYIAENIENYQYMKDGEVDQCPNPDKAVPLQKGTYERLEFLGDAVIHAVLAEYLYDRYPNEYEGFMTRLRTKIENGVQLAKLCQQMGLDRYVLISRQVEMKGGRTKNIHILEDAFEAFVAALFLDSNRDFDLSKDFIVNFIEKEIDFANLLHVETNYKDSLLRYHHKMKWKDPIYTTLETSGPDHEKCFTMFVKDQRGKMFAIGKGNSKKAGEQDAAKQALIKYGELDDDNSNDTDSELSNSDSDISEYSIIDSDDD